MRLSLSQNRYRRIALLVSLSALAIVVVQAQTRRNATPPSASADEIKELRNKIFALEYRLDRLDSAKATVHPEGTGYAVARTKFGPFIVVQKGLTPYLDGYKLKLSIGNPTNMFLSGAEFELSWGPPYDSKDVKGWLQSQKSKTVSVTDTFRPGTETEIEVILTPARPEEVREVEVGITFDRMAFVR